MRLKFIAGGPHQPRHSKVAPLFLAALLAAAAFQPTSLTAQQTPADILLAKGHYLRARPLIQAYLQKNPADPHTLVLASAIQWAFYNQDASLTFAQKAVALDDNSFETHAYLTQPAEGQQPSLATAHWRLALTLEKEGRKPEAIRELQTALDQDPSLELARKDLKRLQ